MKSYFSLVLITLLCMSLGLAALGDADEDTVRDEYDKCADTPAGEIIVDPAEHLDWAGCTCAQIEETIDTENPCISFFCYENLLEIKNVAYTGEEEICPTDECQGTTYSDYPETDMPECNKGNLLMEVCQPTLTRLACIESVDSPDQIPPITGDVKHSSIGGAEFYFTDLYSVGVGEQLVLEHRSVIDRNYADFPDDFQINLTIGDEVIYPDQIIISDSGNEIVEYHKWVLPTDTPTNVLLHLTYVFVNSEGLNRINETTPLALRVNEVLIPELSNPVISDSLVEREFIKAVYDEMVNQGVIEDYSLERVLEGVRLAEESVDITKETSKGKTTLTITPKKGQTLKNVQLVEYIPKRRAEHVEEVTFATEPIIIESDPMIMWRFEEVNEPIDLSYSTEKESDITGNTVLTVEEAVEARHLWPIVIGIALIIILPTLFVLSKKKSNRL